MHALTLTRSVYHLFDTPETIELFHDFVCRTYRQFHKWNMSIPFFVDDYWYRCFDDEMVDNMYDTDPEIPLHLPWAFRALTDYDTKDLIALYEDDWYKAFCAIQTDVIGEIWEHLQQDIMQAIRILQLDMIFPDETDWLEWIGTLANRGEFYMMRYNVDTTSTRSNPTRGGGFSCTT